MFDLKSTKVYQAIRFPDFLVKIGFWSSFIFTLALLFATVFPSVYIFPLTFTRNEIIGWLFIFLTFDAVLFSLWRFYNWYLLEEAPKESLTDVIDKLKSGQDINLADYLSYDAAWSLYKAEKFAKRKSILMNDLEIFLFLIQNKRSRFIFNRLLINIEDFKKSLEVIVESGRKISSRDSGQKEEFFNILFSALEISAKRGEKTISFGSVFAATVLKDKTLQNLFFDHGAKKEDVADTAMWEENYHKEVFARKYFFKNLSRVSGIADEWTFGYTPVLSQYARRIVVEVGKGKRIYASGRAKEIEMAKEILSKSGRNNVILVGEPGVGRENIILGLAGQISSGFAGGALRYRKLMALDMNLIISKVKDASSAVALLDKIFMEAVYAGNVVLVIDEFHNYIGNHNEKEVGALDISGIIIPYLESNRFQFIALTDHAAYHSNIESKPAISVLLEKVEVHEPDEKETLLILEDLVPVLESRNRVFISFHALASAVSDSGSYIQNIPYPEKAISLLTESISFAKSHKVYGNILTQDHITEVISQKTGIPLGRIEGEEKVKLLKMEELLHQKVIGQDNAVKQLSAAMRRVRSGISERKKPIGTFLFLGPTGVGKTETSKALAEVYFGSEERMIRLDMSEYNDAQSIDRLIGSADTQTSAQFANKVRENPFSLILLDEFEKGHPDIADLFLQILDEGRLTDAYQKQVSFRNTIIIATSNAGAEFIREYILSGQNPLMLEEKLIEYILQEKIFKPEFLNRFDGIIVFEPLSKDEVKQVADLMLKDLAQRLEEKGMKLKITNELLDKMAELGYNPVFGARAMKRAIQEKLENQIAQDIIAGKYTRGSEIEISWLQ